MSIREKMLSLLDFEQIVEAFKVTVEHENADARIDRKVVQKYLDKWAEAKEDLFVLFGERLTISEHIDIKVGPKEMRQSISGLYTAFPKYATTLHAIGEMDYVENKISKQTERELNWIAPAIFKSGAKVSKCLSTLFDDAQFDIELSKHLQNRKLSGSATISIHPLDYITLSTNTHKWGSCMSIIAEDGGFNKVGGYSLMMDKNTIIAYHAMDTVVPYVTSGGAFSWNNKISRQLIIFNSKKTSFAMGHYNGTVDAGISNIWVKTVQSLLSKDIKWKVEDRAARCEKAGSFYYDTSIYKEISPEGSGRSSYKIGVESLLCVICGQPFYELIQHEGYLCHKEELK